MKQEAFGVVIRSTQEAFGVITRGRQEAFGVVIRARAEAFGVVRGRQETFGVVTAECKKHVVSLSAVSVSISAESKKHSLS